jgi:hypothetical protein
MHVCVLDGTGSVVLDRGLPCNFDALLQAIAPFRDGIVIGVECMFGWYWLADRCAAHEELISRVELHLTRTAKVDNVQTYHRLQTIPGVGPASSCRTRGWCVAPTSRRARSWARGDRGTNRSFCPLPWRMCSTIRALSDLRGWAPPSLSVGPSHRRANVG